jgi:hypothetical protein
MERISRWCPSKGEATNRDPKFHIDRYLGNWGIPRRRSDDWATQLQQTVPSSSYFGTTAARSISRQSQTAFLSAKFASWQLFHPPLESLWKPFRWKFDYSSMSSIIQSWLDTLWLLAFRAHKNSTGRTTEPQFPGPKEVLTGVQELLNEIQRSELELIFRHWIERVQ